MPRGTNKKCSECSAGKPGCQSMVAHFAPAFVVRDTYVHSIVLVNEALAAVADCK